MISAYSVDRSWRLLVEKRATHPELARELTWHSVRRILAREDVGIFTIPLAKAAQLVRFDGAWAILLNARMPIRRHVYYIAHELAHLWLHVDAGVGREAVCYNYARIDETDDPLEDEADYLAMCLLGGPRIHRQF